MPPGLLSSVMLEWKPFSWKGSWQPCWSEPHFSASHRGCTLTPLTIPGAALASRGCRPFFPARVLPSGLLFLFQHPVGGFGNAWWFSLKQACKQAEGPPGSCRKREAFSGVPEEQKEPLAGTRDLSTRSGSTANPVSLSLSFPVGKKWEK